MNDKCAAGTGRFLEAMARPLEVGVDELGGLDEGGAGRVTLSSMCTVFAESEVVSLIAEQTDIREIVNGLHRAIATRTRGLVKRVAPDLSGLNVSMSGRVARNSGVIRHLHSISYDGLARLAAMASGGLTAQPSVASNQRGTQSTISATAPYAGRSRDTTPWTSCPTSARSTTSSPTPWALACAAPAP